jgi:DNA-binding MarR family transcriptional regulator
MANNDPPRLLLQQFLPYRLSITSNLVSDVIAGAYRTLFNLKIPEWRLIAVIAEEEGVTQLAIGRATRMDKVTVSRATIALLRRKLIARKPNPKDGRSHLLYLTAAGRNLYAQVAPKALELEARIFNGFNTADLDSFRDMLRRIDDVALAAMRDE